MDHENSRFANLDFDDAPSAEALAPSVETSRPVLEIDGVNAYDGAAVVSGAVEEGGPALRALRKAGLDFPVALVEPVLPFYSPNIGDFKACTRMDTGHVLGIVSDAYGFTQPAELAETFDAVIPEGSKVTVGSTASGDRIWFEVDMGNMEVSPDVQAQANAMKWIHLDPRDENGNTPVSFKLRGVNPYGGKGALDIDIVVYVKICGNGLTVPLKDGKRRISIRHTARFEERVSDLRRALEHAESGIAGLQVLFTKMAGTSINAKQFDAFIHSMFPGETPQAKNKRERLNQHFYYAKGAAPGTAWGALQAATYWATHEYQSRVGGRSAKRYTLDMPGDNANTLDLARQESMVFGKAGAFTQQALQYVTTMVAN